MARIPVRLLLKRPGTSVLAVVALGIGIGLTTAMFSIINGVVLRGLPFDQPDRIVVIGGFDKKRPEPPRPGTLSMADFHDVKAAQHSFEGVAASASADMVLTGPDGSPRRYEGARLTTNALEVLRAAPVKGRGFADNDSRPDAEKVVLIGESVWASQFLRDPDIVGRAVHINGEPATVIGVMSSSFGFPEHEHVWIPLGSEGGNDSKTTIDAFGRLRDGISIDAANAELAGIASGIAAARPENQDTGLMAQDYLARKIPSRTVSTFWTMLAAVFGVLLIACVNVANLQLARAADRTREVAIRLALGAGRGRIIRGFLFEGLLLSAAGALLGLAIAHTGLTLAWNNVADPTTPFWIGFDIDLRVLVFTTVLTAFAAVASSLIPALRVTRSRPDDVLKDEGRGGTSLRLGRFSRGLVIAQVALSFALLMASGLVIKSIVNSTLMPIPFRTDVLTGRLDFRGPAYENEADLKQTVERIRQRVSSVPGVSAVEFASEVPGFTMTYLTIEGQPILEGPDAQRAEILRVSPDYLAVMGLRITSGRAFGPQDRRGSDLVAIVSDDFAARYFPNESPIGRKFRIRSTSETPRPWQTIIGTFPAIGNPARRDRDANAAAIVPLEQQPSRMLEMVVAGVGNAEAPAAAIRKAVAELGQTLVVDKFTTIAARYEERTWPVRVFGGLFSAFGIAAMLLASAGLYGVMAFAVRRRTAEIGIRMALGADGRRILRMIVRQGMTLLGIGLAVGGGLGLLLSTQLTQLLFKVEPWDVSVFVTTFLVIVASGLAASLVPARRAAAIDPLVALRD